MITLTLLCMGVTMTLASMSVSSNPLALSLKLLLVASLGLIVMSMVSSSSWFPLIIAMLFLGGVLVMFLILSSLMPNEKAAKSKDQPLWPFLAWGLVMATAPKIGSTTTYSAVKTYIEEAPVMMTIMCLMLFYFVSFIYIVSRREFSMRNFFCH